MKELQSDINKEELLVTPKDRLEQLCTKVRDLDKDSPLSSTRVRLPVEAAKLEADLRQKRIGQIMLKDGESFGIEDASGYYPYLDMHAGDVLSDAARATAWTWQFSDGSSACQLDTTLWYQKEEKSAAQEISLYVGNTYKMPSITRSLVVPDYAETGYEGHGHVYMQVATEADVHEVLDVIEPLVNRAVGIILASMQADA